MKIITGDDADVQAFLSFVPPAEPLGLDVPVHSATGSSSPIIMLTKRLNILKNIQSSYGKVTVIHDVPIAGRQPVREESRSGGWRPVSLCNLQVNK